MLLSPLEKKNNGTSELVTKPLCLPFDYRAVSVLKIMRASYGGKRNFAAVGGGMGAPANPVVVMN